MNRCPDCEKEGKKSKFYPSRAVMTTLMCSQHHYDEEGKLHVHDPNTKTTAWHCSNGHSGSTKTKGSCWCGWGKEKVRASE